MDEKGKTIDQLVKEFNEAMAQHAENEEAKKLADRNMTTAVNRLNGAQRALDKWLENKQGEAPWNTDWHSRRNRADKADKAA